MDAILNHCQDDSFGGEVTVFPPESGVPPHLRVLYQFAFRREEQLVERGLLVVAINQQGDVRHNAWRLPASITVAIGAKIDVSKNGGSHDITSLMERARPF